MNISALLRAGAVSDHNIATWVEPLDISAQRFNIYTRLRMIHWLATLVWESAAFTTLQENLNYSAKALYENYPLTKNRTWGFTPQEAIDYAHKPIAIANHMYANRLGNGNEASGDGWRNRGMGLIQLTGATNRKLCGEALGIDLITSPDLLLQPLYGAAAAGWFWDNRNCNIWADRDDVEGVRLKVNGPAMKGLDNVKTLVKRMKEI